MAATPTTRPSLLLRLRDHADSDAWGQFVSLYGGLVYRFARSRGLQDADAADVTQIVFDAVSREIARLDYDPRRGSFRSWLLVVTRNQLSKYLSRAGVACAPNGMPLDAIAARNDEAEQWEREYRLRAFQLLAERVRPEFHPSSWQAFWRTAVENQSAKAVSEELGISVGAVYTARSRVLSRMKATIAEFDEDDVDLLNLTEVSAGR